MKWIMEIKINGKWKAIHQTGRPPYSYDTKGEAQKMLDICYPETVVEHRRVRKVELDERGYPKEII